MLQRIGLGQAILGRPELVFLDEPTSALDPLGRRDVRALLARLRAEGVTVFLNSHLLSEVELVCDQVAIIHQGRVVRRGPLADLLAGTQELQLTVDCLTADLLAALRAWGEVVSGHPGGREVVLRVSRPDVAAAVAQAVVAQGRQLYALIPHQRTLEEVFVDAVAQGAPG